MADSQEQVFDAELELHPSDGGVFLFVPFNVPEVFGQRAPVHVRGTLDGFPFRLSLVLDEDGLYILPVNKQLRNTIGKTWGLSVHVTMALDTDEPGFTIPEDLVRALERTGLRAKFDQLAYPHRREYVQWVERAKKPEARIRRINEVLEGAEASRKLK
ncbi:YdeI/OmpD-associated family protein [Hymenobacter tibetensis]|uniref:YdeI/OmpD-associated family protein n=1 Tax=Hymenobacter tibetensis TaxID=497967 RepID=A0ABY4CVG3_9BACT|nr:YdeI/OmpD-associated family protein [Hymenobacter tibetensis]UOG73752.1 YdeI/OmpD-associated family protein [Hymenobacter tibetensis]